MRYTVLTREQQRGRERKKKWKEIKKKREKICIFSSHISDIIPFFSKYQKAFSSAISCPSSRQFKEQWKSSVSSAPPAWQQKDLKACPPLARPIDVGSSRFLPPHRVHSCCPEGHVEPAKTSRHDTLLNWGWLSLKASRFPLDNLFERSKLMKIKMLYTDWLYHSSKARWR